MQRVMAHTPKVLENLFGSDFTPLMWILEIKSTGNSKTGFLMIVFTHKILLTFYVSLCLGRYMLNQEKLSCLFTWESSSLANGPKKGSPQDNISASWHSSFDPVYLPDGLPCIPLLIDAVKRQRNCRHSAGLVIFLIAFFFKKCFILIILPRAASSRQNPLMNSIWINVDCKILIKVLPLSQLKFCSSLCHGSLWEAILLWIDVKPRIEARERESQATG